MASDKIMIYDRVKFKIFEPGISLDTMKDAKTTRSLEAKDMDW